MKILVAALLALAAVATGYARDVEFRYVNALALSANKIYDDIPEDRNEKVVVSATGWPLGEVTVLYQYPYDSFVARFAEFVKTAYPGPGSGSIDSISFASLDRSGRLAYPLSGSAMLFDFPSYNLNSKKGQSTILTIDVVDGSGLAGRPMTMVTIVRIDSTQAWLRGFHTGIPLPIKRPAKIRLVTSTETTLLQNFSDRWQLSPKAIVVTNARGNPYGDKESLAKIIGGMTGLPVP